MVRYGTSQHDSVRHGMVRIFTLRYGTVRDCTVWNGDVVVRYGVETWLYDMEWIRGCTIWNRNVVIRFETGYVVIRFGMVRDCTVWKCTVPAQRFGMKWTRRLGTSRCGMSHHVTTFHAMSTTRPTLSLP